MSRYIITIDTSAYKPMQVTEKYWERGTINDFMAALNGYKVVETSLAKVERRICLFAGRQYGKDWYAWSDWLYDPKSKARITYHDNICGFDRTAEVSPYGWKQGYFNISDVIVKLKADGKVQIPFEWVYDIRQYNKRYDGCYMQVVKVG